LGANSIVMGFESIDAQQFGIGNPLESGGRGLAIGYKSKAPNSGAIAMGDSAIAIGGSSISIGRRSTTGTWYAASLGIGIGNQASANLGRVCLGSNMLSNHLQEGANTSIGYR